MRHGGDRLAEVLQARGVEFLFTLCGGHISPILTAARARGLRVVDVRDEATAVFAADAVARLTGVAGVAAVTAGPGLTNTITALENARLAQSPLVVLGGAAPTLLQGRGALQDIDQMALVRPHVKYARAIRRVRDLAPALDDALALAGSGVPGPVFLECPVDLLYPEATVREWYRAAGGGGRTFAARALRWYVERHARRLFAESPVRATEPASQAAGDRPPGASQLRQVGRLLARCERPVLLVGSQTLVRAADAPRIAAAITRLGIPTYLSGMGRGLLGRDHPLQLRHRRSAALKRADCVILAGVPCDFRLDYGRHIGAGAALVAINRSHRDATLNRRPRILAQTDAGAYLCALAQSSGSPPDAWAPWREELRARDAEREEEIARRADAAGEYVNPLALCRAIDAAAAADAVLVADGGDFVATASYIVRARGPLAWLDPGVFGTLGVGAGFALGAKLCRPDSEVWILFGDGACGYGLVEFDTFVRHGIPVIAVVGNDGSWAQIAREQVALLGDDVATVLGRAGYEEVAAGFGAQGLLLRDPALTTATLERARAVAAAGRPVLVNAWLDRTDFRAGSVSM